MERFDRHRRRAVLPHLQSGDAGEEVRSGRCVRASLGSGARLYRGTCDLRAVAVQRLGQVEKANEILGSIFENLDPKEIARNEAEIVKVLERLNNPAFAQKVPATVLAEHQRRLAEFLAKREHLAASLKGLEGA